MVPAIITWIILNGIPSPASASTLAISKTALGTPAGNLLDPQGAELNQARAAELARSGYDISKLDPALKIEWNPGASAEPMTEFTYPPNEATMMYESTLPSTSGLFQARVRVQSSSNSSMTFLLKVGLSTHASLARHALLRRLGYRIPSPQYYSNLTLRFNTFNDRDTFLDSLSEGTLTAKKRWIVGVLSKTTPEVTLQDVVLESSQAPVPAYQWGVIAKEDLQDRREIRALIVPMVLFEIPESINLYSYELGKILSSTLVLTYPYAENFTETTFQDAKWIARKIAAFSRSDLEEIVRAGEYPLDVSMLLLEKLISRRNQMIDLFDLGSEGFEHFLCHPHLNFRNVKDGKLTVGNYNGYAARFSYEDPNAPLRASEIGKYISMEGMATAIAAASGEINLKMQFQTISTLQQQFLAWKAKNPKQDYAHSIGAWRGFLGGFNLQVNRHIVNGPYYGSDAKLQLIDNMSVSGTVGIAGIVENIPYSILPSASAVFTVQRNYLHLRPITEMKAGLKTNWNDVWMFNFIHHLSTVLDGGTPEAGLKQFLEAFNPGEKLVITDSIAGTIKGELDIPIPMLLNPALAEFNPKLVAKVITDPLVMRRTTLLRTKRGVQVYVELNGSIDLEGEVDFNWWFNLLQLNRTKKWSTGKTKAFILDEPQVTDTTIEREELSTSLKALIRWNSTGPLEEDFKPFELKHDLTALSNKARFLQMKRSNLEEKHRVSVTPPGFSDSTRTLFSDRHSELLGTDVANVISNIFLAGTQGYVQPPTGMAGNNPAYSFLGSSEWISVTTEGETTPLTEFDPVVAVEHHWAGWLLPKHSLIEILQGIEKKVSPITDGKPLIRMEEFASTQQLQMYDVMSALLVYKSGQDRIIQLLIHDSEWKVAEDISGIEGAQHLKDWCRENVLLGSNYTVQSPVHGSVDYCLKPWMLRALAMRKEYLENKRFKDDPENQIRWRARLFRKLNEHMEFYKLLKWLGPENYFFQVKVGGFRTQDESGNQDYVSDSLGTYNSREGAGPFKEFAIRFGILTPMLKALSLGLEGF